MNNLNTIILFNLMGLSVLIQSSESTKCQDVIRNPAGEIIVKQKEMIQNSVLKSSTIGDIVYAELQNFSSVLGEGFNAGKINITKPADPVNDKDAATKPYIYDPVCNNSELEELAIEIKDYDGNFYSTVKIGDQVWMAENLKTTHYANGDAIPDGTGVGNISGETEPKYWFAYNDDPNNVSTYGRLYTWYTITDSRNICPVGWHVSTDAEWTTMQTYLGGSSLAGGKIKENGTTHWSAPNTGATNESGFSALPSSYRRRNGEFYGMKNYGNWWSSTEFTSSLAWSWALYHDGAFIARHDSDKKYGFAVRCIKD